MTPGNGTSMLSTSVYNELFSAKNNSPEVSRIVSGSLFEKVVLCVYFSVCVIYIPAANSLIIHVAMETSALHTPQYFLICCYAMCDLLHSVTGHTMVLLALIVDLTYIPGWLCSLQGTIHLGVFFTSLYALGMIAYERYRRFFHPLAYHAYFTTSRLRLFAVVPHLLGQGFSSLSCMLASITSSLF